MAARKPAGRTASTRQQSRSTARASAAKPGSSKAKTGNQAGNGAGRTPAPGSRAGSAPGSRAGSAPAARNGSARGATAVQPVAAPPTGLLGKLLAPWRSMGVLPLVTFVLSLYGLGASIYLTIAHYDTHIALACSDHGIVNCETVTTSSESMVFGVFPVAVLGLAFYAFMVAVNSPWGWRLQLPAVRWARLGSVVVGMGFVLYLIYAELIQINAICLWCTSVHVATFLIFVLVVFYAAFAGGRPAPARR